VGGEEPSAGHLPLPFAKDTEHAKVCRWPVVKMTCFQWLAHTCPCNRRAISAGVFFLRQKRACCATRLLCPESLCGEQPTLDSYNNSLVLRGCAPLSLHRAVRCDGGYITWRYSKSCTTSLILIAGAGAGRRWFYVMYCAGLCEVTVCMYVGVPTPSDCIILICCICRTRNLFLSGITGIVPSFSTSC
jgi:hypothetical protein